MKKILILGGSHSELPLIQEAKKAGLYVITAGNILGNGHLEADEYHLIDYSNKNKILELAIQKKVDYICFGAHDFTILTATYINDKLKLKSNLDDYKTTKLLHYKDKFKQFAIKNGIKTTKFYSFSQDDKIESNLKFPIIIKPIDMGGGKGISVVKEERNIDEVVKYAFKYSKEKKIIIEEFFEGILHSLSVFIVNKKIKFFYSDDEFECKNNKFGVCASISCGENFELIQTSILKEIEKVMQLLNLKDGLLHTQYLQNKDNFSIIEMTRRMPGDLYNVPVQKATGFEYSKNIVYSVLGKSLEITQKECKKFISRYCVLNENDKILKSKFIFDRVDLLNSTKKSILFLEFENKQQILEFL